MQKCTAECSLATKFHFVGTDKFQTQLTHYRLEMNMDVKYDVNVQCGIQNVG